MKPIDISRHSHLVIKDGAIVSTHLQAETASSAASKISGVTIPADATCTEPLHIGQDIRGIDAYRDLLRMLGGGACSLAQP